MKKRAFVANFKCTTCIFAFMNTCTCVSTHKSLQHTYICMHIYNLLYILISLQTHSSTQPEKERERKEINNYKIIMHVNEFLSPVCKNMNSLLFVATRKPSQTGKQS